MGLPPVHVCISHLARSGTVRPSSAAAAPPLRNEQASHREMRRGGENTHRDHIASLRAATTPRGATSRRRRGRAALSTYNKRGASYAAVVVFLPGSSCPEDYGANQPALARLPWSPRVSFRAPRVFRVRPGSLVHATVTPPPAPRLLRCRTMDTVILWLDKARSANNNDFISLSTQLHVQLSIALRVCMCVCVCVCAATPRPMSRLQAREKFPHNTTQAGMGDPWHGPWCEGPISLAPGSSRPPPSPHAHTRASPRALAGALL